MNTDTIYQSLIAYVDSCGDELVTRNAKVKSVCDAPPVFFDQTPLITLRKTAWKKAIREMEWFLSGDTMCPLELNDWWEAQLTNGMYRGGYSNQFRQSGSPTTHHQQFDQVKYVLEGLRNNPNSRRLVMTTWNPYDMAHITELNRNSNTPTCCHSTIIQCFVRNQELHMTSYQRSADILLGVPHNWCQTWAMLMYFAHHANLKVGSLRWLFGDLHLYQEESHIEVARQLLNVPLDQHLDNPLDLVYKPSNSLGAVPEFKAIDFALDGVIPEPICTIRPTLL